MSNQHSNITTFSIEKETEKAVFVSIPYWLETNREKSKHIQKELTLWVPKSQIQENTIPIWVVDKYLKELKVKNQYLAVDSIKKHLGEYAPAKTKVYEFIDDEMEKQDYFRKWIASLPKKYQEARRPIDSYYFIDEVGSLEEYNYHIEKIKSLPKLKIYYFV